MKISQHVLTDIPSVIHLLNNYNAQQFDLHLVFSHKKYFEDENLKKQLKSTFENTILMGCSTAGEIGSKKVLDDTFVLTSIKFENTRVKKSVFNLNDNKDSRKAGETLAKELLDPDLKHVFILSEGLNVNGTHLIEGINSILDHKINVSGGLAGDNGNFVKTYVADLENNFISNCVSAIGFYGGNISTSSASYGGWDSFGIDRVVTKSIENVVYEIDGKPALELYKTYLGDLSSELPASALFFPIEMRESEHSELLVRTILGISENDQSLTFASNIPEGSSIRLMKTNVNRVIDGAEKATQIIKKSIIKEPELVIMVSCIGRKLVLKKLTQDEVEAVTSSFDDDVFFTGFYSYGELSKQNGFSACSLHNQTMTLTSISEILP